LFIITQNSSKKDLNSDDYFVILRPKRNKLVNNMQVNTMNPAQRMILESFAGAQDEQELNDLMDVLRDFYANRLKAEMQRLWDDGTLNQASLDLLKKEHLRTPYRK